MFIDDFNFDYGLDYREDFDFFEDCSPNCPYYRQLNPPGPPSFGPGGPGMGGPGFGPGGPGPGPGPGGPGMGGPGPGGGQGRPPSGPPPSFTPNQPQAQLHGGPAPLAVNPGAIRRCRNRFVYIWPRRGRGFWAWITFVGSRSIAGFRWTGFSWVYFGMDLRNIEQFICH